jgi:hypothetical protein
MLIKTSCKIPRYAIFLATLTVLTPTLAEVFEPEGIRSGSVIYYPYVTLSVGNDDNLYSQEFDPRNSSVTNLGAGVNMQILQGGSQGFFEVSADAAVGLYRDSSADNFEDGAISAGYNYQPSEKLLIKVYAGVKQLHDTRTATTVLTNNEPDVYQDSTLDGELYYGENNSEGAYSLLSFNLTDKSYSTNPATNASKEREQNELSGLILFPLAPNTRLRVSARYRSFDYNTANTLDSTQIRGLLGIEWQASGQTLLSIDVGSQKKQFDQNSISDDSEDAWEIGLIWAPEEYNQIELAASNDFDESITTAEYLTKRKVDLTWRYSWEDYLTTELEFGNSEETSFFATTQTAETITYTAFSVEFDYSQSVRFTASITNTEVDAVVVGDSSDKSVISVGVTTAF